MGALDPLINLVKGIPENHNFWNGPLGKSLGFLQNIATNPQRTGQKWAQVGGSMVPGLVDAAAGPFSPMVGDAARKILPQGAEQRLNAAGVATNPQQSRQMVGNIAQGLLNTAKSAIQRPQDIPGNIASYAYENPMDAAMAIIGPMASPELSAAKVNLVNSMQSGSADLGANVIGGAVPNEEDKVIAGQGWQPGVKQSFDTALATGDTETIKRLLPTVPQYYQQQFADQINNALQGRGMLPGPTDSSMGGNNFTNGITDEPQTQFSGMSNPQNSALNIYKLTHPDASQVDLDRFVALHPGGVYQQPRTMPTFVPTVAGPGSQALSDKMDALNLIRVLRSGGPLNGSAAFKNYMVEQVANSLKR